MTELTELLGCMQAGDPQARDALFACAYSELHRLANGLGAELPGAEETVLAVHEALEALEQADPHLAQVAQMRYFGGYSEQEIAETLEVTERTLQRDWERARLILAAALR
jgi:DNA-binding transcriptional regulator YiaG